MAESHIAVWGPGPFDNVYAADAAHILTSAASLRGALSEALHAIEFRPGDPQYLGYAAAETVAAAGADRPYWQSDVTTHPQAVEGHPGTGLTFYLPPVIDAWVRRSRPQVPLEMIVSASLLVDELLQNCDLWQDPQERRWYLLATARHLESALADAQKAMGQGSTHIDEDDII